MPCILWQPFFISKNKEEHWPSIFPSCLWVFFTVQPNFSQLENHQLSTMGRVQLLLTAMRPHCEGKASSENWESASEQVTTCPTVCSHPSKALMRTWKEPCYFWGTLGIFHSKTISAVTRRDEGNEEENGEARESFLQQDWRGSLRKQARQGRGFPPNALAQMQL